MSLSLKDEFMKIQFYIDYVKNVKHFKNLDYKDPDVIDHMNIMQVNDAKRGIFSEVYKSSTNHWG